MIKKKVYWGTEESKDILIKLNADIKTEIVVVGGGIAGLMCAEELVRNNYSVVILEKDYCGAGASGKTSGFITPDSEIELSSLISNYGPEKAKQIWEFVISGVEAIRENINKLSIECDYQVQDSLFIAADGRGVKYVEVEEKARKQLGYKSTFYNRNNIDSVIGSDRYFAAVRYPDTFGINSYRYCRALKKYLENQGVIIYESSPVEKIVSGGVRVGQFTVKANYIVVCADRFIPDLGKLKNEIYHIQTFLTITKPLEHSTIRSIFPGGNTMTWDTQLVYNYFRVAGGNRILLGGGDVFYTYATKETNKLDYFAGRLAKYFKKYFPNIATELEYIWAGMLGVSKDLMPIIWLDENLTNVYYIGAATGLPWAAALGQYIADKITKKRDDWDEKFSAKRKFVIGPRLQTLLRNPPTFAISHGIIKYLK